MEILFIAPVDKFQVRDAGYGNAAAGIAQVLERMKAEKRIGNIHYLNTARPGTIEIPDHKVDAAIVMAHPSSFLQKSPGVEKVLRVLETADRRMLSVVWETTPLPAKWSGLLNEPTLFTDIITPSYFVAGELRKVVKKPIYYYPHFINVDEIPQVSLEEKMKEETFTVLYIGQHTKRKGLEDSVVSFIRSLGDCPDVRLVLKYHKMTDREMNPDTMIYHAVMTNAIRPKARVYSITEMLERDRMYGLYHMASVLFFPSRGEGFGLPLAEAMSAGVPAIYTGWSSMPEVARAPGNIELDYVVDEAIGMYHHGYDIGSKYAVPLVSSCMAALSEKYRHWKKNKESYYLAARSNRDIIVERFGYDPVSACIEHLLHEREGFAPKDIDERMNKVVQGPAHNRVSERSEVGA